MSAPQIFNSTSCQLHDNPDITGIGIRVAFYVQAYLTIVIAYLPDADVDSSYWSMTITAFALFVSALILHAQGELSIYLGASVSILLYLHAYAAVFVLHGSAFAMVKEKFNDMTDELERSHYIAMRNLRLRTSPVVLLAVVFSLWFWSTIPDFTFDAACNSRTIVVIIGSHLSAIHAGRTISIAIASIHLLSIASIMHWDISCIIVMGPEFVPDLSTLGQPRPPFKSSPRRFWGPPSFKHIHNALLRFRMEFNLVQRQYDTEMQTLGQENHPRADTAGAVHRLDDRIRTIFGILIDLYKDFVVESATKRPQSSADVITVSMSFYAVILPPMLVLSNELTLRANADLLMDASGNKTWTLGQVFPVIMLLVPVVSILKFIWSYTALVRTMMRLGGGWAQ